MSDPNNLDWKKYEAITKYIYETLGKEKGVQVKGYGSNCKVTGKSGVNHQIDVLTTFSDGIHTYKTAIECKYWKEKINKDIVMKVAAIIEDARINKGVIVSKSGFTPDGIEFAHFKNIGLVELREANDKDFEATPKEMDLGTFEIHTQITLRRPEVLKIELDTQDKIQNNNEEFPIYQAVIIREDGKQIPFNDYYMAFKNTLHDEEIFRIVSKRCDITNGLLVNNKANTKVKINGIIFTGMLTKIDSNSRTQFSLTDQVWLVMKSIFEERTFTFSGYGIIVENKK